MELHIESNDLGSNCRTIYYNHFILHFLGQSVSMRRKIDAEFSSEHNELLALTAEMMRDNNCLNKT